MKKNFVWDETVLIPESVTIPFPLLDKTGAPVQDDGKTKTEDVVFREFTRTDLIAFMKEEKDLQVVRTLEEKEKKIDPVTGDEIEVPKLERIPFDEVAAQHSDFVFKWLSKMTRGAKPPKFFEDLDIGTRGLGALVKMMSEVNHIEEVLASAGNWLMLPRIQEVLSQDDGESAKS